MGGPKAVEKTGKKRPWKSQERFPLSHSSNNNKLSLDDRDHFLQNAKTSVASLRRLITPSRNADHDQPGILITFIGIRTRCKQPDSLRLKLRRKRYRLPGRQVTDKIGVRVITYFESDIPQIVSALERELEIDKHQSEDKKTKLNLREFGYLSVHLIARAKGRWSRLVEFKPIDGIWFEIQVRSILEHAWAEIEHEVVYKSGISFPDDIKRRFARLAGALEILSSEFIALRSERTKLVDTYVTIFKEQTKLARYSLDSAKLIAMLEVERPHRVGWRSDPDARIFPPGIEAACTEALKSAGIRSCAALQRVLRSEAVKTAEKKFTTLSLQVPTHLATALIALATESPVIFKDYFPSMATNPSISPLLSSR